MIKEGDWVTLNERYSTYHLGPYKVYKTTNWDNLKFDIEWLSGDSFTYTIFSPFENDEVFYKVGIPESEWYV